MCSWSDSLFRRGYYKLLLGYVRHTPLRFKRVGVYTKLIEPGLKRRPILVVARTRFGRFHCDTQDVIQRNLYAFGIWEPRVTEFIHSRLKPGDAFLDVGANIGYYSILASRLVGPSGSVVAVEPSPSIRRELLLNIDLNGADNVRVVSAAASDKRGEAVIYRAGNANRGSSSLLASRGYAEESVVRTLPLSEVLSELEFSSCRLIKVDVEGHELHVLDGLIPLLASSRPDLEIVIEISGRELELEGASVDALFKKMGALGFLPYLIENDYHPHRYIANDFALKVSRLCAPPDLEVAFDVVFSRTDADSLAVVAE